MLINRDTIIHDNDPLIREKSLDVALPLSKEDEELAQNLLSYVIDSIDPEKSEKNNLAPAVGISAIQVGIKKKILAIFLKDDNGDVKYKYSLVNPKIVSHSVEKAYIKTGEGCLSVLNNHEGYVYRYARIKIKGYDVLEKKEVIIKASDYLAIIFQHEIDHFSGVLYYDHINKNIPFYEDPDAVVIE